MALSNRVKRLESEFGVLTPKDEESREIDEAFKRFFTRIGQVCGFPDDFAPRIRRESRRRVREDQRKGKAFNIEEAKERIAEELDKLINGARIINPEGMAEWEAEVEAERAAAEAEAR